MSFTLHRFSPASDPRLMEACSRLRYRVYHDELGLDTVDMDHARRIDVEKNDPACDFFAVSRASDGELVGCLRVQTSETRPLYSEREFVFDGPWWQGRRLGEGARFAVLEAYRNGGVPMMLLGAFRNYCRERAIGHVVSVAILRDEAVNPAFARGTLRWLASRVSFDLERARSRPGFAFSAQALGDWTEAPEIDTSRLPPMLRWLAHRRTTLCAPPGYDETYQAWVFLLVSRLGREDDVHGGEGARS